MDTNRQALGQLIVCKGCCCGRTDRGRPDVPVEYLKSVWQREKLNRSIQLTVSGCLGPCDVPNVALILSPGSSDWFGRIGGDEMYTALVDWARDCHAGGEFLPPPVELSGHRLDRFRPARPGPTTAREGTVINLFGGRTRSDPGAVGRIKGWTTEVFHVPVDAVVMVTELRCAEDGCPDVETVIAVLDGRGSTRSHKLPKAAADVTREDVAALAPATPASDP